MIETHNKRGSGKVSLPSLPEPNGSEFGLFVFIGILRFRRSRETLCEIDLKK